MATSEQTEASPSLAEHQRMAAWIMVSAALREAGVESGPDGPKSLAQADDVEAEPPSATEDADEAQRP